MATEDSIISAVKYQDILEDQELYLAGDVDALLARERAAAIEREEALKDLIHQNDDCFDDMCTALNDVVDLTDLSRDTSTLRDLIDRTNVLTKSLQRLREGIMD